jgi:uncharacterized LabA/DUF88 family protein
MTRPTRVRTRIYVDGFNFYYGCLKGTPHRWLNIQRLCTLLLPQNDIQHIKYFTAQVTARPHDPGQPVRQQTYFRALETLGNVEIILGHFLSHEVSMPRSPLTNPTQYVRVMKTEEKGSDVNLATQLLVDGFQNLYDVAVVVTNDSDLLAPIQAVRQTLGKKVGILNPYQRASKQLSRNCDFMKQIRAGVLNASQFPNTMQDANGTFSKPQGW